MKWGKIIIIFQAFATLLIGIAFFSQVIAINIAGVSELKVEISNPLSPSNSQSELIDLKKRYAAAAYILIFVSVGELIIITKLLL